MRELYANEEVLERGLTARVLPFMVERDEIPEEDEEACACADKFWSRERAARRIWRAGPGEARAVSRDRVFQTAIGVVYRGSENG